MPWIIKMLLKITPIVLLCNFYVFIKIYKSITCLTQKPSRLLKWGLVLIGGFLNSLPFILLITYLSGHNLYYTLYMQARITWLDTLFIFPFWIWMIVVFEVMIYFLCLDLFGFIQKRLSFFKLERHQVIRIKSILQLVLLIFFIFYVPIRFYSDTFQIKNIHYKISIKNLAPDLKGLRLVLMGDVQVDRFTSKDKLNEFKNQISKLKKDFIFFAGDLVTLGDRFIQDGLNLICLPNKNIKRIACMGDHDIWSGPIKIRNGLTKCGWSFLENRHMIILHHKKKILITGITHVYSNQISQKYLRRFLKERPKADLKILLVHQPADFIIREAEKNGYDMVLAGHTHGGQIVLRPFGIPVTPTQFENSHYTGYKKVNNLHVFVTNGIGMSLAPIRYHAPSEITSILIQ